MPVTIYDIAKSVNKSAVTVSLALRGSERVKPETRDKIKLAAEKLNYQPNNLARGLAGAKTKTIAFVFNFPAIHLAHDSSYMELFHSISQVASKYGYKLMVHSTDRTLPVFEVFNELRSYGVDAVVLGTNLDANDRKFLQDAPLPTVLLGRDFCGKNTSCIVYGDYEGAQSAVKHLVELGHTRICFSGNSISEASARRYDGYIGALHNCGIKPDKELVADYGMDVEAGERAGVEMAKLKVPPTAVICASDLMAIGLMAGFRQQGFSIPEDISVIGFDNLTISRYTSPSITTIDLLRENIATEAIDCALNMIAGQHKGVRKQTSSHLIIRESAAVCRKT